MIFKLILDVGGQSLKGQANVEIGNLPSFVDNLSELVDLVLNEVLLVRGIALLHLLNLVV